jgi:hypothetical protein
MADLKDSHGDGSAATPHGNGSSTSKPNPVKKGYSILHPFDHHPRRKHHLSGLRGDPRKHTKKDEGSSSSSGVFHQDLRLFTFDVLFIALPCFASCLDMATILISGGRDGVRFVLGDGIYAGLGWLGRTALDGLTL